MTNGEPMVPASELLRAAALLRVSDELLAQAARRLAEAEERIAELEEKE